MGKTLIQPLLQMTLTDGKDSGQIALLDQPPPWVVSCYKMNDNAANKIVVDSQGYNNGETERNTNLMSVAGKVGSALQFTPQDFPSFGDWVILNTGKYDTLQNWSFNCWLKILDFEPVANSSAIFYGRSWGAEEHWALKLKIKYSAVTQKHYIGVEQWVDGDKEIDCWAWEGSVGELSFNVWYMITFVVNYAAPTWKFYINNVYMPGDEYYGSSTGPACPYRASDNGGYPLDYILATLRAADVFERLDGVLDAVVIVNKELTTKDRNYLWNSGNGRELWDFFQMQANMQIQSKLLATIGNIPQLSTS